MSLFRLASAGCAVIAAVAAVPARAGDLPPQPRLLLTPAAVERIHDRAAADPVVALVRDATLAAADRALTRRTCEHRIPDGRRLLGESRHALDVVLLTATAWRLTDDRRYFDRCVLELDAACGLPDWNPPHFLDTAEMATAVALGLDWLHAELDATQRERYRAALVAKALRPAEEVFAKGGWWTTASNNWGQVCGAGIAIASAAIAADRAALDAGLFPRCLDLLGDCEAFYADGGYPEGPAYWDYGTSYHVLGLAVAGGLGVSAAVPPSMASSAEFMTQLRGPSGLHFNFADSHPRPDAFAPARGWLVDRMAVDGERPGRAAALTADLRRGVERRAANLRASAGDSRFFPLHLLWLPEREEAAGALRPHARFGREQPVAMLRTSWDDPDAAFVALKGGTPRSSHAHMDIGSFVYDALGRRWIHDLGSDDYNMPGYFGKRRFEYFRNSARSHNVLVIDGAPQDPRCEPCTFVALDDTPTELATTLDLGPAYRSADGPLATAVTRRLTLEPTTGRTGIRDMVVAPVGDVRWQAVIDADATLDGSRAVLRKDGSSIVLEVKAACDPPATAACSWVVEDARPPTARENQNEGFRILSCTVPRAERVEIEVTIAPRN